MLNLNRKINNVQSDWRGKLDELKAMRAEYEKHFRIMTPYEAQVIGDQLKNTREQYLQEIAGGALSEYKQSIKNFEEKRAAYRKAQADEAKRWDGSKLAGEMQSIQMRVNQVIGADQSNPFDKQPPQDEELKRIYDEGVLSGDLYKQRAVLETFKGLSNNPKVNNKQAALHLENQAAKIAPDVRITEEMLKAYDQTNDAWQEIEKKRVELVDVSVNLGMGNPDADVWNNNIFRKALYLVKRDNQTGEIKIIDQEIS